MAYDRAVKRNPVLVKALTSFVGCVPGPAAGGREGCVGRQGCSARQGAVCTDAPHLRPPLPRFALGDRIAQSVTGGAYDPFRCVATLGWPSLTPTLLHRHLPAGSAASAPPAHTRRFQPTPAIAAAHACRCTAC